MTHASRMVPFALLTLSACGASLPLQRTGSVHFASRCTPELLDIRRCPNHPYQCMGELPEGAELIGLIESKRDEPMEAYRERAAQEGADLIVVGPYHQEQMRLGAPPAHPGHVFQRIAVVRLPPARESGCQGAGRS